MALEGTLKDFSLADIFQLIGLQRKTGVLTLRGKDDSVTVTFLDGKVVSADSLNRRLENRLGHVLIKNGTLTTEQLNRALEIQRETLQRLGFILTHYGIISSDSLRNALQMQILQIIYRLFRWKDGEYHFSQETTIEYDRDNVVPITAESILMEGARMIDEWPMIEKRIRSYDMTFRKKDLPEEVSIVVAEDKEDKDFDDTATRRRKAFSAGRIKISQEENTIFDLVDGKRTVGEIVELSRLSDFDTNKALYELITHDVIEEVRDSFPVLADQELTLEEEVEPEAPPVPLPLVLVLVAAAVISLATYWKNPLNLSNPDASSKTAIRTSKKAVSFQRIRTLGEAIEAYQLVNNDLPSRLSDLTPHYVPREMLKDPWGNEYKYLQRPGRYMVVGFTAEGRSDTDLFYSHSQDTALAPSTQMKHPRGGITLID